MRLATHPITDQCPRMKNDYAQRWAERGFVAAKEGKPLDALEDAGDTTWQPGARMAWIRGWEFGGGDIHRRVVVPQRQRWEEERAQLMERIAWLDKKLSESENDEQKQA